MLLGGRKNLRCRKNGPARKNQHTLVYSSVSEANNTFHSREQINKVISCFFPEKRRQLCTLYKGRPFLTEIFSFFFAIRVSTTTATETWLKILACIYLLFPRNSSTSAVHVHCNVSFYPRLFRSGFWGPLVHPSHIFAPYCGRRPRLLSQVLC